MLESAARSVDGTRIAVRRYEVEARFAADPAREMFGSAKNRYRSAAQLTTDLVLRTRMQIKQPSFDSVNAGFSVANVIVELLRTKNVHEASVLRFGSGGALGAAH
jgi:hypothetical protein